MSEIRFDVIAAVAAHAGTALSGGDPAKSSAIASQWAVALKPLRVKVDSWGACYLPGFSFGDAQMFAVHVETGRVVGLEDGTEKRRSESTETWIARIS